MAWGQQMVDLAIIFYIFFSATFGLTKFLKTGPIKIVNHTSEIGQVPLVGFGITMVIIASFMISKAVWVFLNEEKYYTNGGESIPVGLGEPSLISQVFLFWLLFSMIPQILMVSQLDLMKKSFIYFLSLRLYQFSSVNLDSKKHFQCFQLHQDCYSFLSLHLLPYRVRL